MQFLVRDAGIFGGAGNTAFAIASTPAFVRELRRPPLHGINTTEHLLKREEIIEALSALGSALNYIVEAELPIKRED